MSVLKIKKDGKWINIPSIKGEKPVKGIDYWNEEDKEEVKGFVNNSVADLETVLQNILVAIQKGGTTASTIDEIEQLIVSYFETKTVEEVEG